MLTKRLIYLSLFFLALTHINAQEEDPFVTYDVPSQNLLKYNRFLINPTFSTVREDKSYVNLLHRNQSASFDNNNQAYFLSYSGRINDRTGLGLSLYTQREGTISNFGVLANYAYGIKLSDKSNFTFGANVSYYNSGFDENRATPVDQDPTLLGLQDSNLLSFQPGFNLSYNKFDFGVFAENLFDYNLKTNESITEFKDKTFSTHLQYTHDFKNAQGVLEGGRLMPLARARKVGEEDLVLGGNLILDLPKIGWLQGGYDSFYGASAGVGFNLNRRLSLGYTMEKGLSNNFDNFGVTHEISFAYSFTPNLTEDRVMLEEDFEDDLVANDVEPQTEDLTTKDEEIEELKRRLAENDAILAELMYRQDSIESGRESDLERRFEMVMRMVRNETNGNRPDLEEKAKKVYFLNNDKSAESTAVASIDTSEKIDKKPIGTNSGNVAEDVIAVTKNTKTKNITTPIRTAKKDAVAVSSNSSKKVGVKSRKFKNLEGVDDGYYIVANVYEGGYYLNKFVNDLNEQGVPADYFENRNNGLKYVYLERHDTWEEAVEAYKSDVGGNYRGDMWIMNVDNKYTNEAYASNVDKIKEKSSKYGTDVLQKNVVVKDKMASADITPKNLKLNGVGSGYYIIANVFASAKNANRFVKLLNSQGLSAGYFINPENNYRYVYLKKHESWNNALISYYSKLNSAYDEKMWIMRVTPNLVT
ncbi:PorP/SprF family type IX secretion system membrane protein [Costertonia aggregata]|uniref:PorP/SprF family type IX secretion system membrane protein n=1 Tax=Costertonia aggregata TaxID=343403 RepID=A0A7H9APD0_9FLAO|nr:type IX secretion system membrane protein PorP/SprF [Costertonia aggregata]QLG45277.1 PorP/SprF family type IX secretion system membrane protein [Costertonia aggregata]